MYSLKKGHSNGGSVKKIMTDNKQMDMRDHWNGISNKQINIIFSQNGKTDN